VPIFLFPNTIRLRLFPGDSEAGQQFSQLDLVDNGKSIEAEDSGDHAFVFDLGEASGGDGVLLIILGLGDAACGFCDVAQDEVPLFAQIAHEFAGGLAADFKARLGGRIKS
jgi:hypothetical protein